MARESHIERDFYTGTDVSLSFTVYNGSSGTTPKDITGYSLSWMLKKRQKDSDASAKVTKTTSAGITITDPTAGECVVSIADTDTAALSAGVYYHELKRTDDGSETVLSSGRALLKQAVHR